MIKYIYPFCLFVIVASDLESPIIQSVSRLEDGSLYIVWNPVDNSSILGYKIKIWEVKEKTDRMFKLINAEEIPGLVKQDQADEVFSNRILPSNEPRVFKVTDKDATSLIIQYFKPDSLNEIRIQVYKQEEDGPLSEPWRIKVFAEYGKNAVAQRHGDSCMVTVANEVKARGGVYPFIYNSYL